VAVNRFLDVEAKVNEDEDEEEEDEEYRRGVAIPIHRKAASSCLSSILRL
jgi:hypothetical protein